MCFKTSAYSRQLALRICRRFSTTISRMAKTKSSFITWLGYIVRGINICQLIGAFIALYVVDQEELANEWKFHPEKPLISDIDFHFVFGIWIFTIFTGLLHNLLFEIGEAKGILVFLKISIAIGIIKEIVSVFVSRIQDRCY